METYIAGTFWRVCDRCGLKYRNTQTRKEWTGLIVCDKCFETKHPQLSVKSIQERISVRDARPRPTDVYTFSYSTTTLSSAADTGATSIEVASISGISDGDYIGVELVSGSFVWSTVNGSPTGSTVILTDGLLEPAANGNDVNFTSTLDTFSGNDL